MPEPTTAVTNSAVPRNSANRRRQMAMVIVCSLLVR